jgi:hypothetical protein
VPISTLSSAQLDYDALCTTEQRLRDEFVCTRDSGKASVDVIAEHHGRFNDAIMARAAHKRKFSFVKESTTVQATTQTPAQFNYSDVNACLPWMPLKGKPNDFQHDDM